ncbi:DUF6777 domain-containing protein [Pseudonocardia sp. CA-107938]|uniref:DUF6777 domain-containing protein n=1 Tax=Pseudonocardia sp. CA-107938 TaxID=3240021 RepID=UPI003D8C673A
MSPRTGLLAAAAVVVALAAVAAVLVVTSSGDDTESVMLEPVAADGAHPFMPSVAKRQGPLTPPVGTGGPLPASTHGLYGGVLGEASCDAPAMLAFLQADPAKAIAWAGVLGIGVAEIPAYVADLTPLVLRSDTYVTNHGFADGRATTVVSVLQAGTAVFVDRFGLPRIRCTCGNPLTAARAPDGPVFIGASWPGFNRATITVVEDSTGLIDEFTLVDVVTGSEFLRARGPAASGDRSASDAAVASAAAGAPAEAALPTAGAPTARPPAPPQARTVEGTHVLTQEDGAGCSFSDAPRITGSFTLTVLLDGSVSGRLAGQGSGTRDVTCAESSARMAWGQRYSGTFTGRVAGGRLTGSGTLHDVNSTRLTGCTNGGRPVNCAPYQSGPVDLPITLSGSYDPVTGRSEGTFVVGQTARPTSGTWAAQP